jgi:alpha-ribazole phosphatase/probable phosphoglycerate mutase
MGAGFWGILAPFLKQYASDMSKTIIDLIRHGEPEGGRKYRGHTDDPLSETGWRQMREKVAGCQDWQAIVTSPLQRCQAFATELAGRLQVPLAVEPRLKEKSFGVWEGHTPEELERREPGLQVRFRQDPLRYLPEGAEDLALFSERVKSAWRDLVLTRAGQHVLVVAHGGVIRAVMAHVLGMPLQYLFRAEVHYAALTRIKVEYLDGGETLATLVFHDGRP